MRHRVSAVVVAAVVCLAAGVSWADLSPYSQNFEEPGIVQADPDALAADGWKVFGNVWNSSWNYLYGYGPFPAPNPGGGFSAVAAGEGGVRQGAQQLVVYSDYNNGGHGVGDHIEANVFQEQIVGAADVGTVWRFEFDAKRGNIGGASIALAFIKTLDPSAGYALTNFVTVDMTAIPDTWDRYYMLLKIRPDLVGQIFQFGFLNQATNYEGSGIFYDNVLFEQWRPLAATMDAMSATATEDGVLVRWSTLLETDTMGFRVLRESADTRQKALVAVSPMILPDGDALSGAAYEFLDRSQGADSARAYWIEETDNSGKVTRHGPIAVERPGRVRAAGRQQ